MRFVRPERGAARPGGVVTDEHLVREEVGVRSMVVSGGVWLVAGGWWLVAGGRGLGGWGLVAGGWSAEAVVMYPSS